MAATSKKNLTFNVSEATYNKFASLFPKDDQPEKVDTSEKTIIALLEAGQRPSETHNAEFQEACEALQNENTELSARINDLTSKIKVYEKSDDEIKDLKAQNSQLQEQNQSLATLNQEMQKTIDDLHCESKNSILDFISDPFTRELLETVSSRLSVVTGNTSLSPIQVLLDGFLKYNIQQYNLWFYDFVMTKSEILKIANKYNPEIDSFKKLQIALGIYE